MAPSHLCSMVGVITRNLPGLIDNYYNTRGGSDVFRNEGKFIGHSGASGPQLRQLKSYDFNDVSLNIYC